jgi:hypothetical protein
MEPTSLPAPLRTVLIVVSALLAVVGGAGLATGAASDDGDDLSSAGGTTNTTLSVTDSSPGTGGDARTDTTTSGSAATPTTAGRGLTGTTAKPAGPTTTVAAVETNACTAPDAGTNPGPTQAPAVGVYSYVTCSDGSPGAETTIKAKSDAPGQIRRDVSVKFGPYDAFATQLYRGEVVQESLTINAFGQTVVCDWNPDVLVYPGDLSVGKTWSTKTSCAVAGRKINFESAGKVLGRKQVTIGGTAVTTWAMETRVTVNAQGENGQATQLAYFDPARGIDLYQKNTVTSGNESQTVEVRLANLTPRSA